MRRRTRKEDDGKNVEKAFDLLMEVILKNQDEIEPALWISAMMCALSDAYERSKVPFEFFKKEVLECLQHYKY